jgi:hypothetical protein
VIDDEDGVGDLGEVGADDLGPLDQRVQDLAGQATKAVAQPALAAPATSQACADLHRVGDLRPVPADRGQSRPIVINSSIDGVSSRRQIGAVRDGSHRLRTAY